MIPKLRVYHHPLKRWPNHPCVMNQGFAYCGWTGEEGFGMIKPFRYYGWRVTCSACVKVRDHYFQQFNSAVFDLWLLMNKAFEVGELPFWTPDGIGWKSAEQQFGGGKCIPCSREVKFSVVLEPIFRGSWSSEHGQWFGHVCYPDLRAPGGPAAIDRWVRRWGDPKPTEAAIDHWKRMPLNEFPLLG
jgi:hypothetical protein